MKHDPMQCNGVFQSWAILTISDAPVSRLVFHGEISDLQQSYCYGVLQSDSSGRFGLYRPIKTSCVVGFDLENMEIQTINSSYQLSGTGVFLRTTLSRYQDDSEKIRIRTSLNAKRARALHGQKKHLRLTSTTRGRE